MRFRLSFGQILAIVGCVCLAVNVDAAKKPKKEPKPIVASDVVCDACIGPGEISPGTVGIPELDQGFLDVIDAAIDDNAAGIASNSAITSNNITEIQNNAANIEANANAISGIVGSSLDPFSESNLLSSNDQQMINRWIGDPSQLWGRCYASSVDGLSGDTFAELCAHRGPSVVVIQFDNGKISGGYTDVSWTKLGRVAGISSQAFLFSVTHGNRYPIVRAQRAIFSTNTPEFDRYGPIFGVGDLEVDPNMTTGGCNFPSYYAWQGHSTPNGGPSDGRAEISAAREELCGQDSLDTIVTEVEVFLYPEYM